MKAFEFDRNRARWDAWKRPFINSNPFVLFDTGELVVMESDLRPDKRKYYQTFDVALCYGNELRATAREIGAKGIELYDPDGKPLPMLALSRTIQGCTDNRLFLLDMVTECIVGCSGAWRVKGTAGTVQQEAPEPLRTRATAYIAGPGAKPLGRPIRIVDNMDVTPEGKARLDEARTVCAARRALDDAPTMTTHLLTPIAKEHIRKAMAKAAQALVNTNEPVLDVISGLGKNTIYAIAEEGVNTLQERKVTHLTFKLT